MEDISTQKVTCTDPDTLQFCKQVSDTVFWYCEPNTFHPKLSSGADTPERRMLERYEGRPEGLLRDAGEQEEVHKFLITDEFWLSGKINATEIDAEEIRELSGAYGYSPEYLKSDAMLLCECYFESYPTDFMPDF